MAIFLNVTSKALQSVIYVEQKQNLQGTYSLNVEQHMKIWCHVEAWIRDSIGLNYSFTTKDIIFGLQRQNIESYSIVNKTVHISNIQEKPPSVKGKYTLTLR